MNATPSESTDVSSVGKRRAAHWTASLRIVYLILGIWFLLSLGCGILFRDWLDANVPNIGGAPFGFWMSQQGAILGFLGLLILYMMLMNGLDRKYGFDDSDVSHGDSGTGGGE